MNGINNVSRESRDDEQETGMLINAQAQRGDEAHS